VKEKQKHWKSMTNILNHKKSHFTNIELLNKSRNIKYLKSSSEPAQTLVSKTQSLTQRKHNLLIIHKTNNNEDLKINK